MALPCLVPCWKGATKLDGNDRSLFAIGDGRDDSIRGFAQEATGALDERQDILIQRCAP